MLVKLGKIWDGQPTRRSVDEDERARAPRRVVILLSDCRSTEDDDTVERARALPELIILAPAGDHEQAAHLAGQAGARWGAIDHPLDAAAVLDRLLETRPASA